jgi:REP element-mobilizing transposase RayT
MSRPLRLKLASGIYHITSRADRREEIYVDDLDRDQWLVLFGQACKRFNWRCHAYCLMNKKQGLVQAYYTGDYTMKEIF